ncbi:MAG: hypothetical protein OEQ53_16435 [Saprospiraceae bacterium]|nr:hypothetical protein [Saprospiraceae bacterium]
MTVLYFELFSYPLTFDELFRFTNFSGLSRKQMGETVDTLLARSILKKVENYYLIKKRPDWVKLRHEREARANQVRKKAFRRARLIARFPFVRAVFFSGTFAKGIIPLGGDIDFFIVTRHERLWVARTLLILFKKIFLFNSRRFFCVNYFLDENHLLIEERNLYTATEIVTLRPVYGRKMYQDFMTANDWVTSYFPNRGVRGIKCEEVRSHYFTWLLERILAGFFGERMEKTFYQTTLRFWKRKFDHMDLQTFSIALKSRPHVSKHHPNNFQERVLSKHNYAIEEFEKLYKVKLRWLSVA